MVEQVGLGGSCHWCTEAVFASLRGVSVVRQGWLAAPRPHAKFSEGVLLDFNPDLISLADLIAIHVHTHSATNAHFLRHKYRSAVYVFSREDEQTALHALEQLQADFAAPLITQVLYYAAFKGSAPRFQEYFYTDPQRPFCQSYIHPKLDVLKQRFAKHIDEAKAEIIHAL